MITFKQQSKRIFNIYSTIVRSEVWETSEIIPVEEWLRESGHKYTIHNIGSIRNKWIHEVKFFSSEAAAMFKLTWC